MITLLKVLLILAELTAAAIPCYIVLVLVDKALGKLYYRTFFFIDDFVVKRLAKLNDSEKKIWKKNLKKYEDSK